MADGAEASKSNPFGPRRDLSRAFDGGERARAKKKRADAVAVQGLELHGVRALLRDLPKTSSRISSPHSRDESVFASLGMALVAQLSYRNVVIIEPDESREGLAPRGRGDDPVAVIDVTYLREHELEATRREQARYVARGAPDGALEFRRWRRSAWPSRRWGCAPPASSGLSVPYSL